MAGAVRVFIAWSLDGFIAGPDDDLSWLPPPDPSGKDYGYPGGLVQLSFVPAERVG